MSKLDDMTIGDLKAVTAFLADGIKAKSHSLPVGKPVMVRTVTHYYTGRLVSLTDTDIVLTNAAWIAYTGRWASALGGGFRGDAEIEPYPADLPVTIQRAAIVDVVEWRHPLPREQQ